MFLLSALLVGCAPDADTGGQDHLVIRCPLPPCVEVSPSALSFARIDVDRTPPRTEMVTIANTCLGELEIHSVELQDPDQPFDLGLLETMHLPGHTSTELVNPYTYYVSLFQGMKTDSDDVVIHAVAGDYPSGCDEASAGTGYYEATVATDGLFSSICDGGWGAPLAEAIHAATTTRDAAFELTQLPVPQTLQVTVDGVRITTGWEYDAGINSLVLEREHMPAGGSTLQVEYHLLPDCEG